ncbi:MAG: hypothetical protein HY340_03695 [Candidatus Kerfeldbacteria bacterium]|nr:hypothetical protein [Candidatus Kerfeldbacteria bacterium]
MHIERVLFGENFSDFLINMYILLRSDLATPKKKLEILLACLDRSDEDETAKVIRIVTHASGDAERTAWLQLILDTLEEVARRPLSRHPSRSSLTGLAIGLLGVAETWGVADTEHDRLLADILVEIAFVEYSPPIFQDQAVLQESTQRLSHGIKSWCGRTRKAFGQTRARALLAGFYARLSGGDLLTHTPALACEPETQSLGQLILEQVEYAHFGNHTLAERLEMLMRRP